VLVKLYMVFELCEQLHKQTHTERQNDRHTYMLITLLQSPVGMKQQKLASIHKSLHTYHS